MNANTTIKELIKGAQKDDQTNLLGGKKTNPVWQEKEIGKAEALISAIKSFKPAYTDPTTINLDDYVSEVLGEVKSVLGVSPTKVTNYVMSLWIKENPEIKELIKENLINRIGKL